MIAEIGVLLLLAGTAGSSPIKDDERVIFFPTIGYPLPEQAAWELPIHGWIFEPEWSDTELSLLQRSLGLASTTIHEASRTIFAARARWFLVDNERGKRISLRLGDRTVVAEKSGPNGHFHGRIRLSGAEVGALRAGSSSGSRVPFRAITKSGQEQFEGEVHLVGGQGISVISDIDDTIKVSQVRDRKKLLENTFLVPFRAVPGMSEVFRLWAKGRPVRFHYVSASPWQLYVSLEEFMTQEGFPTGTFHLKYFRWKDSSFLNLFESPADYKLATIEPILKRFGKRRFVLVGDSGERDPEAYGTLARKYGRQVIAILIRDVTGEPPDAPRYREAFKDVPPDTWRLFKDPAEIRDVLP